MNNQDFRIGEQLEDLRLQLALTDHLSELEVVLDPEKLWIRLELEGRRADKERWMKDQKPYGVFYQQQVSYFGIMDAVSNIVYGENLSNRERFVRLLNEFIKWSDAGRVSVPHVYQLLRIYPFPEFSSAREHVFRKVDQWTREGAADVTIADDIPAGEVGTWFGTNGVALLKSTGLSLDDLKHGSLLYRHRNRLVHTMREHGFRLRDLSPDRCVPYYVMYEKYFQAEEGRRELDDVFFQLIYPQTFIKRLAREAVDALGQYLRTWRVPDASPRKFDFYFYPQLNPRVPIGLL